MEVWHFEILEGGPKTHKIGKKLDFSFLVFECFHPRPLVRCVPELIFPELGNRPRWEKLRYKTDHDNVVNKFR